MRVNIVGLDKAAVLLALYNNAKCGGEGSQPFMKMIYRMNPLGKAELADAVIDEAIKNRDFYFNHPDLGAGSRELKVDLSGFDFDATLYDHAHSHDGYAAEIVAKLRASLLEEYNDAPNGSFAQLISKVGLAFNEKSDRKEPDNGCDNRMVVPFSKDINKDRRFKPSVKEGVLFEAKSYGKISDDDLIALGAKRWSREGSSGIDNVVQILEMEIPQHEPAKPQVGLSFSGRN